jgi:histidyl-tRNA synthetase
LIQALLEKLELAPEERHKVFDSILDGDASLLAKVSRKSPELKDTLLPLLSSKGQSPDFLKNQREQLCRSLPEIGTPLDDFLRTIAILDELDIKYQINIASGAGFEYYTGIIFQLFAGREKIGGGGRYDALIPSMGGGDVPASGFAVYLDHLVNLVKTEAAAPPLPRRILVKTLPGAEVKEAFKVAAALRGAGFIAELDLDGGDSDYTLEVKSAAALTLVDKTKSRKTSVKSVDELIKLLEAQGAA